MHENYEDMCKERIAMGLRPFSRKDFKLALKEWNFNWDKNRPSHWRVSNRANRILFNHRYTSDHVLEDLCQLLNIENKSKFTERRLSLNRLVLDEIFNKVLELKKKGKK